MGTEGLVRNSSAALLAHEPVFQPRTLRLAGKLVGELSGLLKRKNGFFAFESALHVYPAGDGKVAQELNAWNSESGWRRMYAGDARGCLFFAQDVFGAQFCIFADQVWRFDPEAGEREFAAKSISEWAQTVLDDYHVQTGWPLAHEWQKRFGPIPEGHRLVPKQPFILGGSFAISNLRQMSAETAIKWYATVASKVRGKADGEKLEFRIQE